MQHFQVRQFAALKNNENSLIGENSKLHLHRRTLSSDLFQYEATYNMQEYTTGDPFSQPIKMLQQYQSRFLNFGGYSESTYVHTN